MARTLATHQLRHPIVRETMPAGAAEPVEEVLRAEGFTVLLRRPKAKDMMVFDKLREEPMKAMSVLIARISNLEEDEVAELDAEDFGELGNLVDKALPSGAKTG